MNTAPLLDLYQRTSKHSNYQVLAGALVPLLGSEALSVKSRHEHEHLDLPGAQRLLAGIPGAADEPGRDARRQHRLA